METKDSTRRGLFDWIADSDPAFLPFFDLVQREAAKRGKVFFLESGQGNEFETPEMEGEDLVGWLVSNERADELESQWKKNVHDIDESFDDDFVHVSCSVNGENVKIVFD